ncbi:hemicentin-2-like [Pecten maximus]|uniref:hemicentin-2-like n=1 Tax=Pecten maximus TaxID=6579 RepID=UPI0014585D1D|nr:hemicentin-2-like [Pecten maximus]
MECSSTKLHCEGEPPEEPQIESVGEIYAGNTTTFECTVVGGIPKPTIGWEKDGKDTTTNETWGRPKNKTVFIGYTTFTTSPDDNKASLTCVVNYKPDSFYRRSITLDVLFTPIITIQDNVEVDEADDVTLLCNVTSNPVSTVTWTGPKGCNTSAETTLTLNRIYRTAIGNYTCSAENAIGREQNTAMLYINAPPKMCLHQHGFTKVNQNLKLTCSATGIPTPIVTWFREAEELANTNSPDYIIEAGVSPDNPYLVSSTLTVSDTEGRNVFGYRCRVTNDNGVIQKTFRIRRKLKCRCLSRLLRNCVPLELKQEELDVVVFETKEILAIDKSRLTATVTRFVSANDDRQSSFVIGSVAVTILASLLVLLIGCDLIGHFVIDPQLKNKRK